MIRSTIRVVSSLARPAMIRRGAARVFAVAAISSAAVATTGTTTNTGAGSVAATNTRSRDVAHVSSTASTKKHWSADQEGITAQQRELAKVQSADPLERLAAATTRELLQSACQAPGVIEAVLTKEHHASQAAAAPVADEKAFLSKMEAEFGADVLQVLRRQQWSVNVASTSTKDQVATVVCYFQEGTQRILYRRVSLA